MCVKENLLSKNMRIMNVHSGLAWMARRKLLDETGFYDGCILGSGNRAILCAQLGKFDAAISYLEMNSKWTSHYLNWSKQHYDLINANVGLLQGKIEHLWHGDLAMRQYKKRHRDLRKFDFSPQEDLELDQSGCWRWKSDKLEMHRFVLSYFESRTEDG